MVYRHTYPEDDQAEEVREGFDPDAPQPHNPERAHNLDSPFAIGDNDEDEREGRAPPVSDEAQQWETRDYGDGHGTGSGSQQTSPQYGSFREERNVWGSDENR